MILAKVLTLGTGLALGFGGWFQRKNSRKRKNQ